MLIFFGHDTLAVASAFLGVLNASNTLTEGTSFLFPQPSRKDISVQVEYILEGKSVLKVKRVEVFCPAIASKKSSVT